jgi:hypothetical protein
MLPFLIRFKQKSLNPPFKRQASEQNQSPDAYCEMLRRMKFCFSLPQIRQQIAGNDPIWMLIFFDSSVRYDKQKAYHIGPNNQSMMLFFSNRTL